MTYNVSWTSSSSSGVFTIESNSTQELIAKRIEVERKQGCSIKIISIKKEKLPKHYLLSSSSNSGFYGGEYGDFHSSGSHYGGGHCGGGHFDGGHCGGGH